MLVEQLLILGPGQSRGHRTQCANCCIHNIGIPVQVDLQQKAGTVMASSERSWQAVKRRGTFHAGKFSFDRDQEISSEARLWPLGPSKQSNVAIKCTTANETVLQHGADADA